MPSLSERIVNTGIPLSASLFKSSSPNPPAVVLAYKSVIACNAPTLSALTLDTSANNLNCLMVGSSPAAFSFTTVLVRFSTLNTLSAANFLISSNAFAPVATSLYRMPSVIRKSSNLALVLAISFIENAAASAAPAAAIELFKPLILLWAPLVSTSTRYFKSAILLPYYST